MKQYINYKETENNSRQMNVKTEHTKAYGTQWNQCQGINF